METSEISPSSSSKQQKALFEELRERIGLRKYLHFLTVIKETLERKEAQTEEKSRVSYKAPYDAYVFRLVSLSYPPGERNSQGKRILDALKRTDLESGFLCQHIKEHIDASRTEGSYYDGLNILGKAAHAKCTGRTQADNEVLNDRYILPNSSSSAAAKGIRMSKELVAYYNNHMLLFRAEDDLHDIDQKRTQNNELQLKLKDIISFSSERDIEFQRLWEVTLMFPDGCSITTKEQLPSSEKISPGRKQRQSPAKRPRLWKKTARLMIKRPFSVTFSKAEFATLIHLYIFKGKGRPHVPKLERHMSNIADEIQQLFKDKPISTAAEFLSLVRCESVQEAREKEGRKFLECMGKCLPDSIKRNSESIKQTDYPCFSLETLLKEIVCNAAGTELPKACFMVKNDDVWTQLEYEDGLIMQFEETRWQKDAMELLSIAVSAAQRRKLQRFVRVVMEFFDLVHEEGQCRRANKGNWVAPNIYGDENFYVLIRLYHVLLVRLQTAFLRANADSAEWRLRKHCDEVAKPRLEALDPLSYIRDSKKNDSRRKYARLFPSEGSPYEKMVRFLDAVKKREKNTRSSTYKAEHFEEDVMWAIGAEGNKMFTITRLLARIRETLSAVDDIYFESFEKCCHDLKNGVQDAAKKYEKLFTDSEEGWLIKLELMYSDYFLNDEWGSVGKRGDVSRARATIVRAQDLPERSVSEKRKRQANGRKPSVPKRRKKRS